LVLCTGLKMCAWLLLIAGMFLSFAVAGAIAPLLLVSRWSGVIILAVFIMVFLFMHVVAHTARMVFEIKTKLFS